VSANVVYLNPMGRETMVTLDVSSLAMAKAFISKMEAQWDQRLDALKSLLEE
jgi:hypothetical protein